MSGDDIRRLNMNNVKFDDQLALVDNAPFSGVIYTRHKNGNLEMELTYVDGLPSGLQREWYPDGQIEAEWEAIRGQGSAWSREWYRNGQLKAERTDENQRAIVMREWSEDGTLMKDVRPGS